MAKLIFYEDKHEYEVDGEILPSISELTRFVSREIYGDISQFILDTAADRGSRVHKATEILDKYGEVECSDDIAPYIQAYMQFRKDYKIKDCDIKEIEKAYFHPKLKFAGTIDRVMEINGELCIVDLKSSSTPQPKLWSIGLNGYKILWESNNGNKIDKLYNLQIKNDGSYKLLEVPVVPEMFMACLMLHSYLTTKKKRRIDANGQSA